MGIWSKKSIAQSQVEEGQGHELRRTLTGFHLILLGVGAIIGAGRKHSRVGHGESTPRPRRTAPRRQASFRARARRVMTGAQ